MLRDGGAEPEARAGDDRAPPLELHGNRPTEKSANRLSDAQLAPRKRPESSTTSALHCTPKFVRRQITKLRPLVAEHECVRAARGRTGAADKRHGLQVIGQARYVRVESLHAARHPSTAPGSARSTGSDARALVPGL